MKRSSRSGTLPETASAVALLAGLFVVLSVVSPGFGAGVAAGHTAVPGAVHAPAASGSIVASATSSANPLVVGDSVQMPVTVTGYPGAGASCGAETLAWTMVNSVSHGPTSTVNSVSFAAGASPNGTYPYTWTAQTGNWNFTASLTSAGCSTASSGPFSLIVGSSPVGGNIGGIPGWIYTMLQVTWGAVKTALYQGIAAPISSITEAIGQDIANLEAPWGGFLASWGIWGPLALVMGFGTTAVAAYAMLGMFGGVRDALGD